MGEVQATPQPPHPHHSLPRATIAGSVPLPPPPSSCANNVGKWVRTNAHTTQTTTFTAPCGLPLSQEGAAKAQLTERRRCLRRQVGAKGVSWWLRRHPPLRARVQIAAPCCWWVGQSMGGGELGRNIFVCVDMIMISPLRGWSSLGFTSRSRLHCACQR